MRIAHRCSPILSALGWVLVCGVVGLGGCGNPKDGAPGAEAEGGSADGGDGVADGGDGEMGVMGLTMGEMGLPMGAMERPMGGVRVQIEEMEERMGIREVRIGWTRWRR
jgi:hypothetical protein